MEGALESVRALRLEALEPEWVERVHRAEFVESCAAPGARWERAGVRLRPALAACVRALRPAPGLAWGALAPQLDARALQALLFHAMEEGARGEEAHAAGLLASRLYCRLLALPAPRAYPLYHPQLLLASTACLARVSPGALPGLARFLPDLRAVLADLRPAPDDVVYEALLARLTDAMGAAITNQSDPSKHNYDQLELNKISTISYEIIHILLSGKHDEPRPSAIQLLFKCLLPKLVDASMDSRVTNNVVRAAYVTYSGLLLARYGKSALLGFSILLQHLCYTLDGLERAEVRQSRVSLVTGLMTLLPKKSFKQFVKWLLQLTTTAKAPHRHLALEIASKLLDNTLEEEHEQPAAILEQPSSEQPPISLEEPKSSSEQPDTSDQANTSVDPDQSTPEQPDTSELSLTSSDPPPEAPVHTHSEDSQSSQDTMAIEDDKDNMPQIIALAHTIPHYEVVKAVYERVNDVSSTVRMRALTVLMECVASDQPAIVKAVKKVNGDSEQPLLISLAVKCMGDERAVVRKSAVLLVDMLLRRDPTLLTKNNLGVMVSLCRDTSVMVRTAAITALAELMMKWPRDCTFDAFLAGPMHQLSDPEVKVQELIVELVQKVLFDKLECYTPGRTHSEEAPWMFLSAITRHNMRRHLQKTCGILLKAAKCINHRLVDIISTHVATNVDNDLNCMVLLSCVARHVEYHNIDFVLNYYYQLSLDLQGHDARLLPLVLETLTDWSQYLLGEKRSVLRTHLIDGLREGSWGSEGSRRACAALAAHLDPNNIGWASDLLFACEQRALSGAPVSEWVCAADMTLVAPEQPSPRLVQLFISTAAHFHEPTHELSESARGCVVAGLGRMCVRSRAVAAAAAPALCQLLVAPHAAICVRVNALLALSDICTRYTCIVEPLLGDICSCLENSPQQLRRASARTITRLLLGGFLRLRAPLYYRYCALLADEDAEVREPAEFYMTGCLPADVIYHHFVECVMYYNGCSAHSVVASHDSIPDHNVSQDTVSDRRLSGNDPSDRRDEIPENRITHTPERSEKQHDDSVAQENNVEGRMCHESTPVRSLGDDDVAHGLGCLGMSISQDSMLDDTTPEVSPDSAAEKLNTEKDLPTEYMHFDCRQLIYDIMLQRMSLVQRFNIQCRLATEVFAHAADLCDENELTARFESALMDTVTVLRGPHMRLPRKPQTAEAADIDDLTARVTSNIVSQKMKRTVAEVLVPAVIRLYARLRTRGGQLVAYVVRLATDLLKDYRQEIEELIDNDDELIEHITQFQENIGEEPSFSNRLNIVLQEVPDVEATPYMKGGRKRRAPPARHGRPPPKRALRM